MQRTMFEDSIHISLDRKERLVGGLHQVHFISLNGQARPQKSEKVFKDYILSTETYKLDS